MTRPEQAPTETPDVRGTTLTHPAFGQIRASRVQGHSVLYGSDFMHHNFVTVAISRSELRRDLNSDWFHPTEELIEVRLSESQWATFVSSLNTGSGTPCTIDHVQYKNAPSIPLRNKEETFVKEMDSHLKKLSQLVTTTIAEIEGELGTSLSAKKREAIIKRLRHLQMNVRSNTPFIAKQFGEHMENTIEKAKIEVNAYMNATIQRAGLSVLRGELPLQLDAGEEDFDRNPDGSIVEDSYIGDNRPKLPPGIDMTDVLEEEER